MEKQILILFLGLALCSAADDKPATTASDIPRPAAEKFISFDVYKIESRPYPDGVLSVNAGVANLTDVPTVGVWGDGAGQKWRLESAMLYHAFQLRPTSYESFVLEQDETNTFLKWVASFTRLGQHKLWYLNDAGNGYTQVKNKEYDTCLTATGVDKPIISAPCTNSPDQQWSFIKL
ncbi:hypothetical protein Ocin01_01212 [Orchesella cincta]|uniref:Uncharacterized protein n=1 Tax=Orchesella cincta TaxID=48709 RepID=A0A1D2NJQ9_ORCCI|nr:hypothetical protein Ocin01_01212 [Orchesella cincta]